MDPVTIRPRLVTRVGLTALGVVLFGAAIVNLTEHETVGALVLFVLAAIVLAYAGNLWRSRVEVADGRLRVHDLRGCTHELALDEITRIGQSPRGSGSLLTIATGDGHVEQPRRLGPPRIHGGVSFSGFEYARRDLRRVLAAVVATTPDVHVDDRARKRLEGRRRRP